MINFLPQLNQKFDNFVQRGYDHISKTVKKGKYYSVSAKTPHGNRITELWDFVNDSHIIKYENYNNGQKSVSELLRKHLDGTSLNFYCKKSIDTFDNKTTYLYNNKPGVIYKRVLNKITGKSEYYKKSDNAPWEPMLKDTIAENSAEEKSVGSIIRHSVTEEDNSVSEYILNPKTQCLYKKNIDKNGVSKYYKIVPQGVIRLFK